MFGFCTQDVRSFLENVRILQIRDSKQAKVNAAAAKKEGAAAEREKTATAKAHRQKQAAGGGGGVDSYSANVQKATTALSAGRSWGGQQQAAVASSRSKNVGRSRGGGGGGSSGSQQMQQMQRVHAATSSSSSSRNAAQGTGDHADMRLHSALLDKRKEIGTRTDKLPFHILGNEALRAISENPPSTVEELAKIQGVGAVRAKEYGNDFIGVCQVRFTSTESHQLSINQAILH